VGRQEKKGTSSAKMRTAPACCCATCELQKQQCSDGRVRPEAEPQQRWQTAPAAALLAYCWHWQQPAGSQHRGGVTLPPTECCICPCNHPPPTCTAASMRCASVSSSVGDSCSAACRVLKRLNHPVLLVQRLLDRAAWLGQNRLGSRLEAPRFSAWHSELQLHCFVLLLRKPIR
jgi:hypothetical protein